MKKIFVLFTVAVLSAALYAVSYTSDFTLTLSVEDGSTPDVVTLAADADLLSPSFTAKTVTADATECNIYAKYSGENKSALALADLNSTEVWIVTNQQDAANQNYRVTFALTDGHNTETMYLYDVKEDSYTAIEDGKFYDFTVEAGDAGYTEGANSHIHRFDIIRKYKVTLSYSGPGVVVLGTTLDGAGLYNPGDNVEISARATISQSAPTKYEHFVGWSDGEVANPRTISAIDKDTVLQAVYHEYAIKTVYDTITTGESLTFDDAYIDAVGGRFTTAWGHGADLTSDAKANPSLYNKTFTKAVSAKNLGYHDFAPLPDTLYRWQLKCFGTEPDLYYVKLGGTHTSSSTASSWADPYGSLQLACKHAGDKHAVNGQQNIVLVDEGTYKVYTEPNDSTYVFNVPACVAVYGGFHGNPALSGVGKLEDQVAAIVAAREMNSSDPWDFKYPTVIDGNNARRAATSSANKDEEFATVIDGFTFTQGSYGVASTAAAINLSGNTTLRNCVVTDNHHTGIGKTASGGIYTSGQLSVEGVKLFPTIENCYIHDNDVTSATVAVTGGAIYVANYGLNITNTTIADNSLFGNYTTAYGAGVYVAAGDVVITGSTISGNVAHGTTSAIGGGLYLAKGTATVTTTTFSENEAKESTSKTHGAGAYIAVTGSRFEDVIFTANVLTPGAGPAYGAGLYAVKPILNNVTFGGDALSEGNEIKGVTSSYGAGAYLTGGPTLTNVVAKYNKITSGTTLYGGGLYVSGGPTLVSPVLENNRLTPTGSVSSAIVYGAGAYITGGVTISGGDVNYNRISAALSTTDPDLVKVTSTAYGAGLYVSGNANISSTSISHNTLGATTSTSEVSSTACSSAAYGSGAYLSSATHTLTDVTFSGNSLNSKATPLGGTETAAAYGAGAYISGVVTANNVTFSSNQVQLGKTVNGAGLYAVTTSTLGTQTYNDCSFTGNTFTPLLDPTSGEATALGGGAYFYARYASNVISVNNCTFAGNELNAGVKSSGKGTDRGAGFYYSASASAGVNVNRCVFHDNTFNSTDKYRDGVAIYGTAAVLNLYNSLFYDNTNANYSLYVGAHHILNNTIVNSRGGIYLYAGSASSLVANNIVWNTTYSSPFTGKTVTDLPVKNNASWKALPTTLGWNLADNVEDLHQTDNDDANGPHFDNPDDPSSFSDFLHLTSSSTKLLNKGLDPSVTAVAYDYEGVERPQGAKYDIGAFEYYNPGTMVKLKVVTTDLGDKGEVSIEEGGSPVGTLLVDTVYYEVLLESPGTELTAIATPKPGYRFVEWEEDGVTTAERVVSMSANITLTAVFEEIVDERSICSSEQPYTIVITRAGDPETVLESTYSVTSVISGLSSVKTTEGYQAPYEGTYSTTVKAIDGTTDSLVTVNYTVHQEYSINCGSVDIYGTAFSPNPVYWTGSDTYVFSMPSSNTIYGNFKTLQGDCDSVRYLEVNVIKATPINASKAPDVVAWGANSVTFLMTKVDNVSDWPYLGMKINGGSSMKTIANGGIVNNEDNTVTLTHASGSGTDQLFVEIYDTGVSTETPVIRVYYDVPYLVTKSATVSWNNSGQDLYVAGGTATIGAGGLVARNITVASGATLAVGARTVIADSLTIKSHRDATGQITMSSGGRVDLNKKHFTFVKTMMDKTKYYTMSLPYAVDFDDIKLETGSAPSAARIALKVYSGEERARTYQNDDDAEAEEGDAGKWTNPSTSAKEYRTLSNLTARAWVRKTAGSGIIPANTAFELGTNSNAYREFRFPMTVDRLDYMAANSVTDTIPLSYYDNDRKSWDIHYGWNFVGLPSFAYKATGKAISHNGTEDYPISVYNTGTGKWDEGLSSEVKVMPFTGFFIQAEVAGKATIATALTIPTILAAPSARRVNEQENETSFVKLVLAQDTLVETVVSEEVIEEVMYDEAGGEEPAVAGSVVENTVEEYKFSDNTTLWINDALTAGYDIGRDLEKNVTETENALAPIFYSITDNGNMAINALPSSEAVKVIPLGTRFAVADNHFIALKEQPGDNVEEVLLYDALTSTTANLMNRAYHFRVDNPAIVENRFSLQVRMRDQNNNTPTDVEVLSSSESGLKVVNVGGVLAIVGIDGNAGLNIFDVTGRLISGTMVNADTRIALPHNGVYLFSVTIGGNMETIKVIYNK